jgi:hypothetical protein
MAIEEAAAMTSAVEDMEDAAAALVTAYEGYVAAWNAADARIANEADAEGRVLEDGGSDQFNAERRYLHHHLKPSRIAEHVARRLLSLGAAPIVQTGVARHSNPAVNSIQRSDGWVATVSAAIAAAPDLH